MTDLPPATPAPPTLTQAQLEAAIRQLILVIAPLLTAAGLVGAAGWLNGFLAFAGPIATLAVFLWGQWVTRQAAKKAVQLHAVSTQP